MNQPRVIALGFFDGVHLGHGQLLARCRQEADRLGCRAAALTFDSHPDTLVSGERVALLRTPQDRARLMEALYGIDEVLPIRFDRQMRDMPWEQFLHGVLLGQYHATALICGHDFRFGARGEGTATRLLEVCAKLGVGCAVIPEYRLEGITVSSTYIRTLLESGDLDRARQFLGHPHQFTGTVVPGTHLGRTLGTPTANLEVSPELLLPPHGVYACRAWVRGEAHLAVTNIGVRPTVRGQGLTIEPWLLDYNGDLYGKKITLELWHFLRGERRFPSLEALQAEIHRNASQTRAFFAAHSTPVSSETICRTKCCEKG